MTADEEAILTRSRNEPSNLEVIAAFAPSEHLELFCVGNKNQDRLYVMAQSWHYAKIIAMLGGHIRNLENASRWKPFLSGDEDRAAAKALKDKMPGVLWVRGKTVLTRTRIYTP